MGGIDLRNLREGSLLRTAHTYSTDVSVPPGDEQFIVASTALADNTADADFTLAAPITAAGGFIGFPIRPYVVLRNAGTLGTKPPAITQVNGTFQDVDGDSFEILIEGYIGGVFATETMRITPGTVITVTSEQRVHQIASRLYDQITRVRHQNKLATTSWGRTTPLQVSVGTANVEFGDASTRRTVMKSPFQIAAPFNSLLRRGLWLDDGTSVNVAAGATGHSSVLIQNDEGGVMSVPGKVADFTESLGLFTVQLTGNTLTKVAHGLLPGNALRVRPYADGLPGNLAINTTYYVLAVPTADTLTLATTAAPAVEIDLTAVAPFADGETIEVLRPTRKWRRLRLIYSGGVYAEGRF